MLRQMIAISTPNGGLYHSNTDAGRFWLLVGEVVCTPRLRGGRGIASSTRDGAGYYVEGNSLREKDSAIPPLEEYIQQTNVL